MPKAEPGECGRSKRSGQTTKQNNNGQTNEAFTRIKFVVSNSGALKTFFLAVWKQGRSFEKQTGIRRLKCLSVRICLPSLNPALLTQTGFHLFCSECHGQKKRSARQDKSWFLSFTAVNCLQRFTFTSCSRWSSRLTVYGENYIGTLI